MPSYVVKVPVTFEMVIEFDADRAGRTDSGYAEFVAEAQAERLIEALVSIHRLIGETCGEGFRVGKAHARNGEEY